MKYVSARIGEFKTTCNVLQCRFEDSREYALQLFLSFPAYHVLPLPNTVGPTGVWIYGICDMNICKYMGVYAEYMQIYVLQLFLSFPLISCVASAQQAYHCLRMSPLHLPGGCWVKINSDSRGKELGLDLQYFESIFDFVQQISWEALILSQCSKGPTGETWSPVGQTLSEIVRLSYLGLKIDWI